MLTVIPRVASEVVTTKLRALDERRSAVCMCVCVSGGGGGGGRERVMREEEFGGGGGRGCVRVRG